MESWGRSPLGGASKQAGWEAERAWQLSSGAERVGRRLLGRRREPRPAGLRGPWAGGRTFQWEVTPGRPKPKAMSSCPLSFLVSSGTSVSPRTTL